ncbi:TonB-dependent receptor [bacterium]|nr:TonB-dependent receptor [bacterium]
MNKSILSIIICLGLIFPIPSFSYQPSSVYLLHPQSANLAAMAEVNAGMPYPNTMQFNPAATVLKEGLSANLMYNFHLQGIHNNSAGLYWRKKNFNLGTEFFLSSIDDIEKRTIASPEPLGTFTSHNLYLGFNLGYTIKNIVTVSARYKYLYERIDYEDASNNTADFGILIRQNIKGRTVNLGGSVCNFGKDFTFLDYQFPMPKVYRAGVSFISPDPALMVGFDLIKPEFSDFLYALGAQYQLIEWLELRGGYIIGHDTRSISAGVGFLYRNFTFDYAFVPYRNSLGFSHLISVGFIE